RGLVLTARAWGWAALPVLAAALAAAVRGSRWLRRWRQRRLWAGARLVEVAAPVTVDPDGGVALWSQLLGLLTSRWRRRLFGQPHLAFEYVFTPARTFVRIWVPGPVPPGLVEHAVTAAWPGARTTTRPAPAP